MRSLIADPQRDVAKVGERGRHDHLAARIGEMDRVADQVHRDLAQRRTVGDDRRRHLRSEVRMMMRSRLGDGRAGVHRRASWPCFFPSRRWC